MSAEIMKEFTSQQLESIKQIVIDSINLLLPKIIKEITPLIIQTSRDLVNKNFNNVDNIIVDQDATKPFFNQHHLQWNKLLIQRKDLYYKYARCEKLLLLYAECIEEDPIYVPRKFRQDSYHTNSQAERNVINTSNLHRFQTECEILRIRREQYMKEITSKDDYIKKFY